jgi:hypothetical protein
MKIHDGRIGCSDDAALNENIPPGAVKKLNRAILVRYGSEFAAENAREAPVPPPSPNPALRWDPL